VQLVSGLLAAWVVRIVVEPVQLATATATLAGRNVVAAFVVELLEHLRPVRCCRAQGDGV
jgi:hypothetical protein